MATKTVTVKMPDWLIEFLDELVARKCFATRSDAIRVLLLRAIEHDEIVKACGEGDGR